MTCRQALSWRPPPAFHDAPLTPAQAGVSHSGCAYATPAPMAFYVYIATNKPDGVLYTGMTDDMNRRMWEHREHLHRGFTDKYNCEMLVWFEVHESRESAFTRERQIKEWKRDWKLRLINEMNPDWRDLADELL